MKSEELMIGNYISYKGEAHKVVGIIPPYLDLVDLKGNQIYSVHEERIEPIPLTREILDRNCIHNEDDKYYFVDFFVKCRGNFFYCNEEGYFINYIHELQNFDLLVNGGSNIKL